MPNLRSNPEVTATAQITFTAEIFAQDLGDFLMGVPGHALVSYEEKTLASDGRGVTKHRIFTARWNGTRRD